MAFFGMGNSAGEFNSLTDVFAILSMGNVGQSGFACASVKWNDLYEMNPGQHMGYGAKEQRDQYESSS